MNDFESSFFRVFEFPEALSHVCGCCMAHRGKLHMMSGYNFVDITTKKFDLLTKTERDTLQGQHLTVSFLNGTPEFVFDDMSYCRFIGASCVYSKEYETAFLYGGTYEEVGANADHKSVYVSARLFSHKFRESNLPFETIIMPTSVYQPTGRNFHASVWDSDTLSMWIFGGGSIMNTKGMSPLLFNDLWNWSSITNQWTLIKTINPPSARWGHSLVYLKKAIYLFGGHSKLTKSSKNTILYKLDISPGSLLRWERIVLPTFFSKISQGCVMICLPSGLFSDWIFFTGGQTNEIIKELNFAGDLKVEFDPKECDVLSLLAYNIDTHDSKLITCPERIKNVSYHNAVYMNDFLYLVGGVNNCPDGVSFAQSITRVNIVELMKKTNMVEELPIQKAEFKIIGKDSEDGISFDNLLCTLVDFARSIIRFDNENQVTKSLQKQFYRDQLNPYPIDRFVRISSQYIKVDLIENRFERLNNAILEIHPCYSYNFVHYLYSGTIDLDHINYDSFSSFNRYIRICYYLELYKLIWFEIIFHIHYLSIEDIIQVSILKDEISNDPYFVHPKMKLLKYFMGYIFKYLLSSLTESFLMDIISKGLITGQVFDIISSHFSSDIDCLLQDFPIGDKGNQFAAIEYSSDFSNVDDLLVRFSIIKNDVALLFLRDRDLTPSIIYRLILSIGEIDKIKNLSAKTLREYYQPCTKKIRNIFQNIDFRNVLLAKLPSYKSIFTIGMIINYLGIGGSIEIVTNDKITILTHKSLLNINSQKQRFQFDVPSHFIYALMIILYSKCDINQISHLIPEDIFSKYLFIMANSVDSVLPSFLIEESRNMIEKHLFLSKTEFSLDDFIEMAYGSERFGLFHHLVSKCNSHEWVEYVDSCLGKFLSEKSLRLALKASHFVK